MGPAHRRRRRGKAERVEAVSRVATRDRAADLSAPRAARRLDRADLALFTAPTRFIPTGGIVRETARKIVGDADTDLEKTRRIYDWAVANTYRNPKTRGCGRGDIAQMLKSGDLGGKCADINGLFVGLSRAAGLLARDLHGLRVAAARRGVKSLGVGADVVTKAQHCRAELFLSGFGWTAMDPADVRKFVLEEPPGGRPLDSAAAERAGVSDGAAAPPSRQSGGAPPSRAGTHAPSFAISASEISKLA
jgi:transglutaminase-like putative cysteine protease